MTLPPADPTATRRRRLQQWGVVLWPGFIVAGVASMVFFAFVDPLHLGAIGLTGVAWSRELGYTLGFFMFWMIAAASSAVTGYLLRPLTPGDEEEPLG